jgi:F-type H+-transporting ATPase subunit gamma
MTREATERRRQAVETVHNVVSAMRAIAAGRIQSAQRALEGARRYHEIVLRGLSWVLPESATVATKTDDRPGTLLVMTSEQPLCGTFNPNVLALAERRWNELRKDGSVHLFVVGQRGLRQLLARGITPDGGEPAATSLEGLHDLVKRLAKLLGTRYANGELGALRVIYSRYQSISEQVPAEVQILPPDLSGLRQSAAGRPTRFHRYLSSPELLAGLVDEYAFISLYLIAAESYASEQASRLVAMDSSTRNTEQMLATLIDLERRERQAEITREVLELISARFADASS